MNNLKNVFQKHFREIVAVIVIVTLTLWAGKGPFKYEFYSTHDGLHHIARSYDALGEFGEGQFPLRWAGSLNYGCGVPIFNLYYPLFYYLIYFGNLFLGNIVLAIKVISFLSLLVGGIFFFLWGKSETKTTLAAFVGSVVYLFAPYRFVLIYVRGSPEYLSYAIFPIVLYFYSVIFNIKTKKLNVYFLFLASLFGGVLAISHNFAAMFLMPILLVYLSTKILLDKWMGLKDKLFVAFSFLTSFGLAAFFILPALAEKGYTKIGENKYYYLEHFPTLWQIIKSKWGYFYSLPGTVDDGMSFMLGYAQWLALLLVFVWLLVKLTRSRNVKTWFSNNLFTVVFFFLATLSIFLTLPYSEFIWRLVPVLAEIQFPWRILGVSVLLISMMTVYWLEKVASRKMAVFLGIIIALVAIYGNRNHLLAFPVLTKDIPLYVDFEALHPNRYSTTTLGDDVIAKNAQRACNNQTPAVSYEDGDKISHTQEKKGNTYGLVRLLLGATNDSKVVFGLDYFPGIFRFSINGKETSNYLNCGGLVCFSKNDFRAGENIVYWQVISSPVEKISNVITVLFFVFWVGIIFAKVLNINTKRLFTTKNLVLAGVFLMFGFARFYNLNGRIGFGWDEERDAIIASGILSGKLTLIGPRVIGPEGFFLPPWFFYLLTPFYLLYSGDPHAMVLFIVVSCTLFFILSYKVLGNIFSKETAIIFIALWSINVFSVSLDTTAWNPVLIPTIFIALLYIAHKDITKKNNIWSIILGFIFGLGISFHFQFVFVFPLVLIIIANKSASKVSLVGTILGLIASFSPLILFDLRHNFLNTKLFVGFFTKSTEPLSLSFVYVWTNVIGSALTFFRSWVLSVAVYIAGILMSLDVYNKTSDSRAKRIVKGVGLSWLVIPLFFVFYRQRPSEYYFSVCIVMFFVILSLYLALLWQKRKFIFYFISGVILVLTVFNLKQNLFIFKYDLFGLDAKNKVADFLSNFTYPTNNYNVSFDIAQNGDGGFRYLLKKRGLNYDLTVDHTLIQVLYPAKSNSNFLVGEYEIEAPASWLKALRIGNMFF